MPSHPERPIDPKEDPDADKDSAEFDEWLATEARNFRSPLAQQSFLGSIQCAVTGMRCALLTQRNVRLQASIGACAILAGIIFELPWLELALVCLVSAIVIGAELMNTAVEFILDHHVGQDFHPSVKLIKDIAAASVFVLCLGAAAIGAVVFYPYLRPLGPALAHSPRAVPVFGGLTALCVALMATYRVHQHRSAPSFLRVVTGILLVSTLLLALIQGISQ